MLITKQKVLPSPLSDPPLGSGTRHATVPTSQGRTRELREVLEPVRGHSAREQPSRGQRPPPPHTLLGGLPRAPPPAPRPAAHFWHSSSTKARGWSSPDMVMTVSRSKAPVRVWSTVWRVMVDVV